jgi:hypothetical protein
MLGPSATHCLIAKGDQFYEENMSSRHAHDERDADDFCNSERSTDHEKSQNWIRLGRTHGITLTLHHGF